MDTTRAQNIQTNTTTLPGTQSMIAGRTIPQAGTWSIDPAHSSVAFSIRHATITNVRGRFTDFTGTIQAEKDANTSSVMVVIQAVSLNTANPLRDTNVRGTDWLDCAQFPTLEFRSQRISLDGLECQIDGALTIHGVTCPVSLDVEYVGMAQTPQGEDRIGFTAHTTIDRRDFGIARNVLLASGGWFVAYTVHLDFDISAIRDK